MKIQHFLIAIALTAAECYAGGCGCCGGCNVTKQEEQAPQELYKILSIENWNESQGKKSLKLSADDKSFIHFSTEGQLDRILTKYWNNVPKYVLVKIDPKKLPGKLVFEENQGGVAKYYHLYDGSIPTEAIVASEVVSKS